MKVKIMIFFIMYINIFIYAHKQHVHQYLTKEAYYQLRDYLGYNIPEMFAHLDNGPVGASWANGTLLAGVWLEDEYDAIYQYDNNSVAAWIPDGIRILFDIDKTYVSITHFWDADNGDWTENQFTLNLPALGSPDIGPFPNAYTKAYLYKNGGYILKLKFLPYLRVQAANGDWLQFWSVHNYGFESAGSMYYSLIDLYKNKRMHTNFSGNVYNRIYNERLGQWVYYYGDIYLSEDLRDKVVWEILGRMVHLLQDLSEPTHAHIDEHGIDKDPYEEWISGGSPDRYQYYNHNNIQAGIIDPYQSNDPLHFLIYTTQQISDHFASRGPYNGDGDNILGGNPLPEEITYLTNIGLSSLGGRMDMHADFTDNELQNIRDKTIPHIIRAAAGLLYWFATEAGIMPPPPLSVSISGPSTAPCATGTWRANVSGGYPPYTYQWYHMFTSGGGGEGSLQKGSIIIQPDRLINTWYPVGNNTSTLNYYLCGGNSYLRVDVRDSHNTLKTVQYYVAGSNGGGGGLEKEDADNNSNDYRLELETPKEYSLKQNYPNPFNPSTIINYSLKTEGKVSLKIYNTLGQEVITLVDEIKPAGSYEAVFNASELPSGIYIYRMQSAEYLSVKKMLLIK